MTFSQRKIIITGATRGIGKAIAHAFLDQGALVIGTYSSNESAAEALRQSCADSGKELLLYKCDVADHSQVQEFYQDFEQRFDTVDILINNAGIRLDALTALMNLDDWQRVLDINLTGSFIMSKYAVPLMLKQKYGRIINITSPAATLGINGQANYAASKAGQIGLMRTLAKEVARKKITVNCVSPGFIQTDLLDDLSDEQLKNYKNMVPMRRFGRVEEVAQAVLFLASEQASYITGTVLDVTGGL